MVNFPSARLLALALLTLSLSGCLSRTRTVNRRLVNPANLRVATLAELVQNIDTDARKIHDLSATVEIATSVGGAKKGKVTEYQQIKGYILEKDPDMLRMIGRVPLVGTTLFDMVSDGKTFKLSIPVTNRFIEGPAQEGETASTNTLENLRPHVFFDSLLLHEISSDEIPVLEQSTQIVTDEKNKKKSWEVPDYVVDIIKRDGESWYMERKIEFERINLKPYRQLIYDQSGQVATEAIYDEYQDFNGINFPSVIQINRPKEEYSVRLTIEKLQVNIPMTDEQFVLTQPPGARVKVLK
jgi:outer membrane lipoprotein-sorting protein